MKIPIKVKRWLIVVRHKETNHTFVEDVAFKTIEEATEYGEIIKRSGKFEVADIRPIIFFVDIETRGNALFVEDNTIIFLKGGIRMIVMGYPGIGKTTLAKMYHDNDYIDLETSNFDRHDGWVAEYCNVAEDLSYQGYIVLTGCHKEIRNRLTRLSMEELCLIYPSVDLKEAWINRLSDRAIKNGCTVKDLRALKRVREKWNQDHKELEEYINKNIDYCSAIIINEDIFSSKYYIDIINGGIQNLKRMVKETNRNGT